MAISNIQLSAVSDLETYALDTGSLSAGAVGSKLFEHKGDGILLEVSVKDQDGNYMSKHIELSNLLRAIDIYVSNKFMRINNEVRPLVLGAVSSAPELSVDYGIAKNELDLFHVISRPGCGIKCVADGDAKIYSAGLTEVSAINHINLRARYHINMFADGLIPGTDDPGNARGSIIMNSGNKMVYVKNNLTNYNLIPSNLLPDSSRTDVISCVATAALWN